MCNEIILHIHCEETKKINFELNVAIKNNLLKSFHPLVNKAESSR